MAARYGWLITRDHLAEQDGDPLTCEGISGPRDISPEFDAALGKGKGVTFRMYDDDGELYVTGRIVGDFHGFEPLDDYGTAGLGATEIRYRNSSGRWVSL